MTELEIKLSKSLPTSTLGEVYILSENGGSAHLVFTEYLLCVRHWSKLITCKFISSHINKQVLLSLFLFSYEETEARLD